MDARPVPADGLGDAKETTRVPVVFISNDGYAIPTAVAVHSLIGSRRPSTRYVVYVVASDMSEEYVRLLEGLATEDAEVRVVRQDKALVDGLHTFDPSAIAAASVDALLKLFLPSILPDESKVLYLDGDILIKDDLAELYSTSTEGCFIAAVPDSGAIYYKHDYVKQVTRYFNSGVMLMDLDLWRREGVTQRLVDRKRNSNDSSLVDQNVLNLEFEGRVAYLPPRFNVLWVNLLRAIQKNAIAISDFNDHFRTSYASFDELRDDAAILHFSSKDKPWKFADTPSADEWYRQFLDANIHYPVVRSTAVLATPQRVGSSPLLSVIVPFYQAEQYLNEAVRSALCQDVAELEVICVDDGSTDSGADIVSALAARDSRVRLVSQGNRGAGAARNAALRVARGDYVLFLDSDDWLAPNSLLGLYRQARDESLDVLMFEGTPFYETEDLRARHPEYESYYKYKHDYDDAMSGPSLFVAATHLWDMKDSAAMRLLRREFLMEHSLAFPEGIVREDCYFAFAAMVSATRAAIVRNPAYVRRVRVGSVMTGASAEAHYRGLITVANLMLESLATLPVADVVIDASAIRIGSYLRQANRYLASIPSDEAVLLERQYHITTSNAAILSRRVQFFAPAHRVLAKSTAENVELRQRISDLRAELSEVRQRRRRAASERDKAVNELQSLKRSLSYRLGRALAQPVRIVVSGVRSLGRRKSASQLARQ